MSKDRAQNMVHFCLFVLLSTNFLLTLACADKRIKLKRDLEKQLKSLVERTEETKPACEVSHDNLVKEFGSVIMSNRPLQQRDVEVLLGILEKVPAQSLAWNKAGEAFAQLEHQDLSIDLKPFLKAYYCYSPYVVGAVKSLSETNRLGKLKPTQRRRLGRFLKESLTKNLRNHVTVQITHHWISALRKALESKIFQNDEKLLSQIVMIQRDSIQAWKEFRASSRGPSAEAMECKDWNTCPEEVRVTLWKALKDEFTMIREMSQKLIPLVVGLKIE